MMKKLIEAVTACKTDLPVIASEYKKHANFASGFDEALRVLIQITAIKPELVNEIKKEALIDVRINLEQRTINLRERVAVIERDANHLASRGKVKESEQLDESLIPTRNELINIGIVRRYLLESL
jgi:hypothetical protein